MARDLESAFITELAKEEIAPILLAKINTSGGDVRAWTGVGDITFDGEVYVGGGDLVKVSELIESNDLSAKGMAVSLSGIPSDLLATALGQVEHGRVATLWLGLIESVEDTTTTPSTYSLGLVDAPYEIYSGFTDVTNVSEQGETSTITVNIENRLIALEVAKIRRYTDENQKGDYPNDKGMEFVNALQDMTFKFGGG
jgi:hypothetical protein